MRMQVEATRKALDALRPATETLAALQASVRDRSAAVAALRTKAEEGAKAQQALCEKLAAAQAGLQGAEQELERAIAAEAERARSRQAAPDPEAVAVEERVQQIAHDPEAFAAALVELDQMRSRLFAAVGQSRPIPPEGPEPVPVEVSSPKKAKTSIVDLLLAPGGKRQLQGGTAEAAASVAGIPREQASDSSIDLL